MKKIYPVFIFLLMASAALGSNKISYMEPCSEARYVSIYSNIIIGFEKPLLQEEKEILNSIEVTGSKSMLHTGTVLLMSDRKRIIFKASAPFMYDEKVSVKLFGENFKTISKNNNELEYSFYTSKQKVEWNSLMNYSLMSYSLMSEREEPPAISSSFFAPPALTVSINNNPSEGYIFTTPLYNNFAILISDRNAASFWYQEFSQRCADFKKQPNGNFTYFTEFDYKHYEINNKFEIINSYYCGNGYTTDLHDLHVMNNGHAYVMAYDPQIVDMSQIVPGGNPNATVIGLIIQEIDENKNVVFQWRSWDHFRITDAIHENLLNSVIDYVHGNAIEIDNDNNLLISSRHLDEITKINSSTGEIIWRLGGKNNEFIFINDTIRFNYQHDIRRIANGNITFLDNGNFHFPPFSRAVEYRLDESNKTATLVWQYRNNPPIFALWGGNVQRLANGNTFIGWGGASASVSEIKPSGEIAFQASFPLHVSSYRAYKFDYDSNLVIINNQSVDIPKNFVLTQNYPNPFNPSTKISFSLPVKENIELKIYDILGREISELINGSKEAGNYTIEFNAEGLPSGVYFYTLRAADFTDTKKMILMK